MGRVLRMGDLAENLQVGMKRASLKPSAKPMARSEMKRGTSKLNPVGARAKRMHQGHVPPTAEEKAWMQAAQAFGCIVCWLQHQVHSQAEIHHLKRGDRRMGHLFSLSLCYPHHRGGAGTGMFISRHPWGSRFEAAYGTELDLLEKLRLIISAGEPCPTLPVKIPDW